MTQYERRPTMNYIRYLNADVAAKRRLERVHLLCLRRGLS